MKTLARQSNSKTLVKACTAAVLLATCINAQANSNVQNLSEEFRAETMHNLQVEQYANNVVAPSFEILNNAANKAAVSKTLRNETLSNIKYANNVVAPSFEILSNATKKAAVSKTFRSETLSNIKFANNVVAPSFEILNNAASKAAVSKTLRNETLNNINANANIMVTKPSLNNLNTALEAFVVSNPTSNIENSFTAANTKTLLESVWASTLKPTFASFDTLDLEVEDAASNQVKLMTIDFAITALETARTNFTLDNTASL